LTILDDNLKNKNETKILDDFKILDYLKNEDKAKKDNNTIEEDDLKKKTRPQK